MEERRTGQAERCRIYDEADPRPMDIGMGLGIDAGGTCTDAAIYDFKTEKILNKNKALTTKWDFSIGIDAALAGIPADVLPRVELVSVSTTLATNAIVEGEGQAVGLILMTGSMGDVDDQITHRPRAVVQGRLSINGEETQAVDREEIRRVVRKMVDRDGVSAFAVSGFAGSVNPAHELLVKEIIREETGRVTCCGHELSDLLNFVSRAQTAVLNARIIPRMMKFFNELQGVLERRGILAPILVVKGDGTLMSAALAQERPVETTLSGPAASVAGARKLTGLEEAIVVDMGGTTTDTADISDGRVEVCEAGACVGGFVTHVKALDMRTVGLGGDSLIRWTEGRCTMGPRRVGPLSWAHATHAAGLDQALNFMDRKSGDGLSQTIYTAMDGPLPPNLTEEERCSYEILRRRPHAPEELAEKLGLLTVKHLSLERLEGTGLVQCCGLTPTDLLHVQGRLAHWDASPARKMLTLFSQWSGKLEPDLVKRFLEHMEKELALELLKKQMCRHFSVEEMENLPAFRQLMTQMVDGSSGRYSITARVNPPVIGIGAPSAHFLAGAGKRINASVILPEDGDVANAVGAVTSHIRVEKTLRIKTNRFGRYAVEGIAGSPAFDTVDEAEAWAVDELLPMVLDQAEAAGTLTRTVAVSVRDRVAGSGKGVPIFLERIITGVLSGPPDKVFLLPN